MTFRQVERKRYYTPVVSFFSRSLTFNNAATEILGPAVHWQVLVDDETGDVAFRPAEESDENAFPLRRWQEYPAIYIGERFITSRGLSYRKFSVEWVDGDLLARMSAEVSTIRG